MCEHPDQGTFLYPVDSMPLWTEEGWTPYAQAALHRWSDEWLVTHFLTEVERVLWLVQVPPTLMGEEVWTRAVLGSCQHLAQVYHEFRRRYKARKVRRFVREALLDYIYWEPKEAPESAEADYLAPAAQVAGD